MRSALALALCATATCAASAAHAEGVLGSERHFNIELHYARYAPQIDSEFSTKSGCDTQLPFVRLFGSDPHSLLQIGYEHHLYDGFGTLSAGGMIGYFNARNGAVLPGTCASATGAGTVASDGVIDAPDQSKKAKTEMTIVPLQAQVTYRLDTWEDYIPLVPVVRLGLDYDYWRINGTSDKIAHFETGQPAEGGTWGWHYTLGVHVLLDYCADDMAADFDRDAGVNSTYFTVEYSQLTIDDFGSKNSFRLGDKTLVLGLSFDI